MKRHVPAIALVFLLGACNFFGTDPTPPFTGWFHTDRSARASNIQFVQGGTTLIRDFGCGSDVLNVDTQTTWLADGDGAVIVNQWGGPPRFVQDPAVDGGLLATPGMYIPGTESWLPGATCIVCAAPDAGVVVACDTPGIRDGGL